MRTPEVKMVWDGRTLTVPADMGTPAPGQLAGSALDNLIELAGRVSYDSLGSGRDSAAYHRHIREVRHGSVLEHAGLTFESGVVDWGSGCHWLSCFANRRGAWLAWRECLGLRRLRVTLNLRTLLEWERWSARGSCELVPPGGVARSAVLGRSLLYLAAGAAPLAAGDVPEAPTLGWRLVSPAGPWEESCSLYFAGVSRGLTHELVRHRMRMSQRSTRYCDESGSDWVPHPEIASSPEALDVFGDVERSAAAAYDRLVPLLQSRLAARGADKLAARKQARGAARGVLGNALETKILFTASLGEWQWMLTQRAVEAADAEIRAAFVLAFRLLSARWPAFFAGWREEPAADGSGPAVRFSGDYFANG